VESIEDYFNKIKEIEDTQHSLALETETLIARMVIKFHPHFVNDVVPIAGWAPGGKQMLIRKRDLINDNGVWKWIAIGDLLKADGTVSTRITNRIWKMPVVERRIQQKRYVGEDRRQW